MTPLDTSNPAPPPAVDAFIARWQDASGAERANCQSFLIELCHLLRVPPPDPASGGIGGDYRFERSVWRDAADVPGHKGRMDLYKRSSFILEAKQGTSPPRQATLFGDEAQHRTNVRKSKGWAQAMLDAKGQAEGYARGLVRQGEVPPPFLIVCDVGFCFDLYADFSNTGLHYAQFPDREGFRIHLTDLRDKDVRERLRQVWTAAATLNPALTRQRVTQDIAHLLAKMARLLEGPRDRPRHTPEEVAGFLTRCIFCMFAQSVGLLPQQDTFTALLEWCKQHPDDFGGMVGDLWAKMDTGGFSGAARAMIRRFNGGMFVPSPGDPAVPLPLDAQGIGLLWQASKRDWQDVEPAIFGTLLEQALDTTTRGQLGAEFTPRAFVERLVLPTVMEPLRLEWDAAKAVAREASEAGRTKDAVTAVRAFHAHLCEVVILDPACGTGNFLYVTLELMKRLEGEVLDALTGLEGSDVGRLDMGGLAVGPNQFYGLDLNPRAVPVAELVLWIGHLQWHFRTRSKAPPAEPILHRYGTIRHADALLDYAREEPERDARGNHVTRWGGRTKLHPITGEAVPDETDRALVLRPVGAKPAEWPEADFIVGNPPFIGPKRMRDTLGDGYVEALWAAYPKMPRTSDFVMFWWHRAAQLVANGAARRFGLITSNSLDQFYNSKVVAAALEARKPISLVFAIPDHPWSAALDAAAVRIAMTVGQAGVHAGKLVEVVGEREEQGDLRLTLAEQEGRITARLRVGDDPGDAKPLRANERLCFQGCKLGGSGFIVSPAVATSLGSGKLPAAIGRFPTIVRGNDLTSRARPDVVIDLFGMSEAEARRDLPAAYQHVLLRVKPERDECRRPSYRAKWWLFQEPRPNMRAALSGLRRYIATVETAKHRVFTFLPWPDALPDGSVMVIASEAAFVLGVLQSRIHVTWTLQASGDLEDRPRYHNQLAFDPFPFPAATPLQQAEVGVIAEELDGLRKARMAATRT